MAESFDAVIIGSGFGGAIAAARLAEQGYRVLVLERGLRWTPATYPRRPGDQWVWDHQKPAQRHGWFDFRLFPNMAVVQGAGVGGGSLVYANISINAKPDSFDAGWPPEITYAELTPYYDRVGAMLDVQKVPTNQWPERTKLMKEAAEKNDYSGRFRQLDLAVTFDPDWHYGLPDPHATSHSKTFVNAQGQEQGTCVHLGECDIGCRVKAKNTLDLTYIPLAERHHADVRPLHIARNIVPEGNGYRVHYDRIDSGQLVPGSVTGRIVVLAAGSMGTSELLLQCRDLHRSLPALSPFLGRNWSSNGDFLTPALHPMRKIKPTRGPTITSAIDLLDGAVDGQSVFIEDGGLPDLAVAFMRDLDAEDTTSPRARVLVESLRVLLRLNAFERIMPWFAQARDAADGRLSLKDGALHLDWDIEKSARAIEAVVRTHEKLARSTGGMPLVPITWTLGKDLVTPHALGGANMGTAPQNGVVDHKGEVFGYRNLFVTDGAIVPEAIGLNPSKTIGALAERIAAIIAAEGR
ncbi:MAG: GMC oxidoreductase [Vicinamibacterales bacterium]